MKPIIYHIYSPWYMSAGDKYGWASCYSREGIGLAKSKLKSQEKTRVVEIGDKKGYRYFTTVGALYDFFRANKESQQEIIPGKWLLIFPRSIFEIREPRVLKSGKVKYRKSKPKDPIPTLF